MDYNKLDEATHIHTELQKCKMQIEKLEKALAQSTFAENQLTIENVPGFIEIPFTMLHPICDMILKEQKEFLKRLERKFNEL